MVDDIGHFCAHHNKVLDDIEGLLTENRIFKQRNVDIGVVSLKECFEWGFSGVMVRGSGAAWDCASPALRVHSELDFDIPIGKNGDCYDRYLIRMQEMRESVKIMQQCVELLSGKEKAGPVSSATARCAPKRGEMKRSMEALIHHFKLYTEGYKVRKARSMPASRRPRASLESIW